MADEAATAAGGRVESGRARALRRMSAPLLSVLVALRIVAAPLLIAALSAFVFAAPAQVHEAHRVHGEAFAAWVFAVPSASDASAPHRIGDGIRLWIGAGAVWLLATTLAFACGYAARRVRRSRAKAGRRAPSRLVLLLAPLVAFALPLGGYLYGLSVAFETDIAAGQAFVLQLVLAEDADALRLTGAVGSLLERLDEVTAYVVAGFAAVGVVQLALMWRARRRVLRGAGPSSRGRRWRRLAFAAATLGTCAAIAAFPTAGPQTVGFIAVVALFLTAATFIVTQLSVWSQRFDLPILALPLVAAVLFAAAGWTDNHRIRLLEPAAERTDAPGEAGEAFVAWLRARADLAAFEGRPYPVYVVAAQGGGAYAAAQTVQVLRRAQATCDRFNQHLFAISGVSGGAVGASMIAAMASVYSENDASIVCPDQPPNAGAIARDGRVALGAAMAAQDFLSPLAAGMLFPDALQRFTPYPIEALSRARAQEAAFEAAWDAAHEMVGLTGDAAPDRNPLAEGLRALWRVDGAAPALVLNTTDIGSGGRRVVAPFEFDSATGDLAFLPLSDGRDIPVSTAAGLSARFPWVSPPGWYDDADEGRRVRLVDGGYFENSGVATALDLIEAMEAGHAAARAADPDLPDVAIHLIALTTDGAPVGGADAASETLGPLWALLSTRQARARIEIARAERRLSVAPDGGPRVMRAQVEDLLTALPLGWRISASTQLQIALQSGDPARCDTSDPDWRAGGGPPQLRADCTLRRIFEQLR